MIGRNGAGKSTLLKILSRIVSPTKGTADIYGRVGSLLEVGTGFHPELTGRENIFLSGALLGMTRAEVRVCFDDIVAFAGVEAALDQPVKHYSSGMHARLGFAVAAHLRTEILLLDEVLAVGDAEFQRRCLGKAGEMARDGRAILFVSHHMAALRQFCTAGLVLQSGRVAWHGRDIAHAIALYHRLVRPAGVEGTIWNGENRRSAEPAFDLVSLRLVTAAGDEADELVSTAERLWLEVAWLSEQPSERLSLGYRLRCEGDVVLYWSFFTDRPPQHWPPPKRGLNRVRTEIPRALLNEGEYHVDLLVSLHAERWLYPPHEDTPSVRFVASGLPGASPNWTTRRPGPLAPVIVWESLPAD